MRTKEEKMRYDMQYAREHIKRITLDMQKKDYDRLKDHVTNRQETVNGFIKRAINNQIDQDNKSD